MAGSAGADDGVDGVADGEDGHAVAGGFHGGQGGPGVGGEVEHLDRSIHTGGAFTAQRHEPVADDGGTEPTRGVGKAGNRVHVFVAGS